MMIKAISGSTIGAGIIMLASLAQAQAPSVAASWGLYTYPREGQPLQQMQLDEGECIAWARDTTGVDPNNPGAGVQVAQPQGSSGVGVSAGTGAVRGAAKAGLIGNVAGKSGNEWAAYGAVIGAARGAGRRQAQNDQAQAQAQADAQAQTEQRMQQFLKAFSVCMDGRNYTVSGG
jgi:hypothetical protein